MAQSGFLGFGGVVGDETGDKTRYGDGENGSANKSFHGWPQNIPEKFVWIFPTDQSIVVKSVIFIYLNTI
jgi:hypothetical protein